MLLEGSKITMLFDRDYGLMIEVHDTKAGVIFLRATLTAEQVCSAFSRITHTECKVELFDLSRVGLIQEHKRFDFPLGDTFNPPYKKQAEEAYKVCLIHCPEGWEADKSFNSQGSFFHKEGKPWASTTIRRWVSKEVIENDEKTS